MKRRIVAMLLSLILALMPVAGTMAEEEELFFSGNDLTQDKAENHGGSALDNEKDQSASILESLGQKDWDALADAVKLSGDWRDDLVAVAQSQVGYAEESNGMTVYTQAAGKKAGADWTALFINWVAEKADLSSREFPRGDSYKALRSAMNKVKAVKTISRSSYPTAGDLAFIESGSTKLVGIVTYVSNGYASIIAGDVNGRVVKDTWAVGKNGFTSYADLNVLMERAGIEVGKGGEVPYIPEGGLAAWTNTNAVYMRSEPTTASSRVTTVKKSGSALVVYSGAMQEDGYIWYQVKYNKYSGYIRGDLLALDMEALQMAAPAAPTATPAPAATAAPTAEPHCGLCAFEAGSTALPVECCYEHLKAMGEYAAQFMAALQENDAATWQLYVRCHDTHVEWGEEQLIPLGGLSVQERVVNIDVKKALVGEAITISFQLYGAKEYQWYQVTKGEDNADVVTEVAGADDYELTVYAKPGVEISYYCVAKLTLAGGQTVELQSKLITVATGATPVVAQAILGEKVNYTYEYVGAAGYQWYVQNVNGAVMLANDENGVLATGAQITLTASAEMSGAYYYCEALDASGRVLSTSSPYVYQIDTTSLDKYVDELVGMTRDERYEIMNGLWYDACLDQSVKNYWAANSADQYPDLLCTCTETMNKPFGGDHDEDCGWYIESTEDVADKIYYITVTYGAKYPHSCEIKEGERYDLYYEGVLVHSSDNNTLYFEADDEERVYKCVVTKNGTTYELTYVVTAYQLGADRVSVTGYDEILDKYIGMIMLNYAEYEADGYTPTGVYDRDAIYELMAYSWNKNVMDQKTNEKVNLSKAILSYWNGMEHYTGEDTMFCICCIDGDTVSDKIMLHPDAIHTNTNCPWYEAPEVMESTGSADVTLEGIFPDGLSLTANTAVVDANAFAKMQAEGERVNRVSLTAYDITPKNADGTVWQPAKGTTVKVTIPAVYTPGDNVVVNVYHLLVAESEIAQGYGYEKMSSDHYNGVTLNADGSITFETDGFSTFYVEVQGMWDPCVLCDDTLCAYSDIISVQTISLRYNELVKQNGSLSTFLNNYYNHVDAGALDLLCSSIGRGMTKDQLAAFNPDDGSHAANCMDENCPWNLDVIFHTDIELLVGDKVTLDGGSADTVWYCNGTQCGTGATIEVVATAQKKVYTCQAGDVVVSTHVVVAQTSILYNYMWRIGNDYYNADGTWNKLGIYILMTETWNVVANANQKTEPMNLAQAILAYWDQTTRSGMDADMFCDCCFTTDGNGNYTFDGIMNHPDAPHLEDCPWHDKQTLSAGLSPVLGADGAIEGYTLAVQGTTGKAKLVATAEKLDENYFYFKDEETGLYVAYLHFDEAGDAWIIPLPSEKDIEETPAN